MRHQVDIVYLVERGWGIAALKAGADGARMSVFKKPTKRMTLPPYPDNTIVPIP
jgi:hypothetical protein